MGIFDVFQSKKEKTMREYGISEAVYEWQGSTPAFARSQILENLHALEQNNFDLVLELGKAFNFIGSYKWCLVVQILCESHNAKAIPIVLDAYKTLSAFHHSGERVDYHPNNVYDAIRYNFRDSASAYEFINELPHYRYPYEKDSSMRNIIVEALSSIAATTPDNNLKERIQREISSSK